MSQIFLIVATACLTLLGGCVLFLFTSFMTELLIKPYLEYRRTLVDITFKLVFSADIIASAPPKLDRDIIIAKEVRELAARLRASTINFPPLVRRLFLISTADIHDASGRLIRISNALQADKKDYTLIGKDLADVQELLKISI